MTNRTAVPSPLAVPVASMREPVERGDTRPATWRLQQLERLERLLATHEEEVLDALAADLGKPAVEGFFELVAVRQELKLCKRQLRRWMAPHRVATPVSIKPGRAWWQAEPLGCVLIIGPWNYPFQLCLHPLVSALAAGNSVVLKPSEHAPHTAALIATLIEHTFDPTVVQVVLGDGAVAARLLQERFDHIFFTGGERVGRLVMGAAAQHLTPVTLELGGKSPAIVLANADLAITARRLAWGKGLNAGQTCIAPDYLLVQAPVREALLQGISAAITQLYGSDPLASPDLGRIINATQFERLEALLQGARSRGQVLVGGRSDAGNRRIEPTLVAVNGPDDPLMQDEIFGPILPVLSVEDLEEALTLVRRRSRPLALYLFSKDTASQEKVLACSSSGGVCFNDVVLQAGIPDLPFGGVGASGMGSYHGESGFLTFSHRRSVLRRPFWLDLPARYAPYGDKLARLRRLMG
ncbi:aldehyde dehydrogenase family protein [Synechococcus sp. CBW1002]|uniref:aldehyde dehydrogenase family protein n=1 Tax=Synechococcus sp. CBW1002 TaxID=1353134 RepID=UPI001E30DA20|nr:aldehyde dehydrogenase family protein [Synechococcus sp. CBW1002]